MFLIVRFDSSRVATFGPGFRLQDLPSQRTEATGTFFSEIDHTTLNQEMIEALIYIYIYRLLLDSSGCIPVIQVRNPRSSRVMTVMADLITKRFTRRRQEDSCMAVSRQYLTVPSESCQVEA